MVAYDFLEEEHRVRLQEAFSMKKMITEMDRTVKDGS